MDYKISVEHSSPSGIIGILSYYDVEYGVALVRDKPSKESRFLIYKSRNDSAPGEFRLEMDDDGTVREYTMHDGERIGYTSPIALAESVAETVSQGEFLRHVADVLTTL